MAIYFVSSADGSDAYSGATLDLAWATYQHAVQSGGLSAGDIVMVRRTHSEIPTSDIAPIYDGTGSAPIKYVTCPRSSHSISSSDWTNGSAAVVVDDADMSRSAHQARYISAPDGNRYMITRVIDASNIVIDREYSGTTSLNDATASINADTSHAEWTNYDDSADTIKKADWEADADTRALIDFNDGAFQLNGHTDNYNHFYNIEFKDSSDGNGIVYVNAVGWFFHGCLFKQSVQNAPIVRIDFSESNFDLCTLEGSASGTSQYGVYSRYSELTITNCAIYNLGDYGIRQISHRANLKNANIGVEQANGDADIWVESGAKIEGIDIELGGTNGIIEFNNSTYLTSNAAIENYQKSLGDHRTFYIGGYHERAAVSGETPNQNTSPYVIKIVPNINVTPVKELAFKIYVGEIGAVTTGAKTITVPIYNNTGVTLNDTTATDDIWIEAEQVTSYDDTSEYTIAKTQSAQIDILDAADADDWDNLTVAINPATTSKVRIYVCLSFYSATGNIFIDSIDIT